MIIVRRAWRDIPDGALIVGPSGRIWRLDSKFNDPTGRARAELTDPERPDTGTTPTVNPDDTVEMIETDSTLERAVDMLSRSFAVERM